LFTDLEKKQILFKSFEVILPDYENCQYQLTYAVGMMFKYDTNLAFQMWEKLLRYYEKILMKDEECSGILCERTLATALQNSPIETISEGILANNYIKTMVFGFNAHLGRSTSIIITYFVKMGKFDLAEDLFSITFSNRTYNDFSQSQMMYHIIQGLDYMAWEASEGFIKRIIETKIKNRDKDIIDSALQNKIWQRANESPLTKQLIEKIINKDFSQGDKLFNEIVSSNKFDLDSVLYRVIQAIGINDWMTCDFYIDDLLKRSGLHVYSEKLQKAINKKENLKANRISKQKK